jgi:beta-lactam-binding protein with PASTA domain
MATRSERPAAQRWWVVLVILLAATVAGFLVWFFAIRDVRPEVPNLIGMQSREAVERVHKEHLASVLFRGPSSHPKGVVFAQKPAPGVRLDEGEAVEISISKGPLRNRVPNVIGLRDSDAFDKLVGAGFHPQVRRVRAKQRRGIVVEQTPAPRVSVLRGAIVLISVSRGVKP